MRGNRLMSHTETLTVMLADDEPLARGYLEDLLKAMPDIEVLGSFKNGSKYSRPAETSHRMF